MTKVYAVIWLDEAARDDPRDCIVGVFSTHELAEQLIELETYNQSRGAELYYDIEEMELDAPLVSDHIMGIDFYSRYYDGVMCIAKYGPEVRPGYAPLAGEYADILTGNKFIQHKVYRHVNYDHHRVIVWGADLRTLVKLFENYWDAFQKKQEKVPNWTI